MGKAWQTEKIVQRYICELKSLFNILVHPLFNPPKNS